MDNSNAANEQPTIKIGGGGQTSPTRREPAPQPPDRRFDFPEEEPDAGSSWGGSQPSFGNEAPPTVVGQGFGPAGFGPDLNSGQETVLLRPNQKPAIAWLVVAEGPYAGHLYSLDGEKMIVGREQAHIVLGDPAVSGQHAAVWAERDSEGNSVFFVQDLASSNGTSVNGVEQIKARLDDGDRLKLGDTVLVFKQI